MKNLLFLSVLFLLSCSKDDNASPNKLSTESKAVYDALWGQTFFDDVDKTSITYGNTIEFTDQKDGKALKKFKVESVEDYVTTSADVTTGVGFLVNGSDGYTCKTYLKDGETNYFLVYVYKDGEKKLDKIIVK